MRLLALTPRLAAAALCLAASLGAHADDPVNGRSLYSNHCASCHGASPLTSNSQKIYNGRNARAVIDAAISNVGDMNSLRAQYPAGGTALADLAAYLGNTPISLSFAATAVGSTSAAQAATVYASLKGASAISGLTVAASGDFARTGGTCGTALATGTSCTVLLSFSPLASGNRSGTLNISHSQTLAPIAIALSGTGAGAPPSAPLAQIAPASLALAATAIGATSAAQNVTLSNTGSAALSLSAITLGNPADFIIAGGTCSAGGGVAAGSSCTISVAFKPAAGATGTRSGTLSISHSASGSPGSVALSGSANAAATPAATLSAALSFGSVNLGTTSAAQTATLSNVGAAPLVIGTLSTGSTEFVIGTGTCAAGASLAAAGSCTVSLRFAPTLAGARSANLVITHNASGGQSSSSLAGTGVALNPVIGIAPTTLAFSQTVNTTSAVQTVTVSNTGNAALAISGLSIGGAQAAEFRIGNGSTCTAGGSVAANGSCAVVLDFTPAAAGARSASLSIAHNAAGSPSPVTLNGNGTATAQPAIALNASALSFAAQALGSASANQSVTVSNVGTATLTLSGLTLTGTAAADFTRGGTCTTGGTLAVGASCSISFSFRPGAAGARSATLTLASNASNGSAVLSLAGSGAAAAAPGVLLTPAALAFGNQTIGLPSTARSVVLSNNGTGALTISGISATAGFGVAHNCGASLGAAASCSLAVTFTPGATGAVSGSVAVASNAAGSPRTLSLSGTGVASTPALAWTSASPALDFGEVALGASAPPRALTLANLGPGAVTLQRFTLAGMQAADFSLNGSSTCAANAVLAQGASCTLALAFQPTAVGARAGTLQVASSGSNPPDVALSGSAAALAQAAAQVVPGALSFNVPAGAAGAEAQTLTLLSAGNAVLRVTALRVAAGSFTLTPAAASACLALPFDLVPAQSCALAVGWSSSTPGSEAGLIEIDTSASAAPLRVAIQATREKPASVLPSPPGISNTGAGGCSIVRGDTLADPTLWLLVVLAAALLWRRNARRQTPD